ncbi:MAG TPA: thioredoxin fold domain-containing protein [Ignavibacteria bacterium]|nr:thioredoxin fold domain-containing protein [Ignavibacteria bacterium]
MKKLFLIIVSIFILNNSSYSLNELQFEAGSFNDVLQKAKSENKVLMIDFITDWCVWCIQTDLKVYTNPEIIDFADKNQINWKVDAEKGEGIDLAKKYNVKGFPTIVFVDGDGNEVDRIYGYIPPKDFLTQIQNIAAGKKTIKDLTGIYESNPSDVKANYELGEKLASIGRSDDAKKYFEFVVTNDAENTSGYYDDVIFQKTFEKGDTTEILTLIGKYPESNVLKDAYITLFNKAIEVDNKDGIEYYRTILEEKYRDDEFANFYIGQYFLGKGSKIAKDEKATREMTIEGIEWAEKSAPYFKGGVFEASPNNVKSQLYYNLGEYDKSLEYINNALKIWSTRKSYLDQKKKVEDKLAEKK